MIETFMSTYATDQPAPEVQQAAISLTADDPSGTTLEEEQQTDTPVDLAHTPTASSILLRET